MELLRLRPRAVGELVGALPISQPAVSQHLSVLKRARLVRSRTDGARRVYELAPEGLVELQSYLGAFWDEALSELRSVAESTYRDSSG